MGEQAGIQNLCKEGSREGVFFVRAVGKGAVCKKAGSTVYPMKEVVT
jgi:hypothetical protein